MAVCDPQLEQPVGVVDLEEPAGRDLVAHGPLRDQPRATSDRELVRRRLVLVRVERVAAVLHEIGPLRGVQQEHVQPAVHDPDRNRVDPRRQILCREPSRAARRPALDRGGSAPGSEASARLGRAAKSCPAGVSRSSIWPESATHSAFATVRGCQRPRAPHRPDRRGLRRRGRVLPRCSRAAEVESWDRPNGRGHHPRCRPSDAGAVRSAPGRDARRIEVGRRVSGTVRFAIHVDDSAAVADAPRRGGRDARGDHWSHAVGRSERPRSRAGRDAADPVHVARRRPRPWSGEGT